MTKHAGPPCGNNPNYSLTDGDRQAVDGFRAYLAARAALRNRIAEALEQADYRPDMRRGDLADAVMAVLPNAGVTAALAEDLRYLLNYRGPGHDHERPGVWDRSGMPCGHCARREAARRNLAAYDASSDAALPPPADDEGDELVCVDQCGSCDACGMEPFGTPAEGWRQAAHFLRRAARTSGDRAGALHGARLIEAELRRLADEAPARCAHCGTAILRETGTLAEWWVHQPGGNTVCHPEQAANSTRATPQPAATARQDRAPGEEQHDEPWPVKESTLRYAEELRANPGTASADGHTGWECDAGASLLVSASTPGPGALGTHHGTIYACTTHRSAAVEHITAAGYEADPQPAPPGHRWNPWPCGHVTAHGAQALNGLTTAGAQQDQAVVTVHAIPVPGSNGISACCGRPPCEFVGERVTRNSDEVTCTGTVTGALQDGGAS